MKKILLILLVLLVSGCNNSKVPNNEEPQNPVITKVDVLKQEAIKIYGDKEPTSENIGYYSTPLRSIIFGLQHADLFENCDTDETRISYTVSENDGNISSKLTLIFVCDGKTTKYYYDSLTQEEPTRVYESQ